MAAEEEKDREPEADDDAPPRIIRAEDLFGPHREIWIEHDGIRYRLRITRRSKLILQK
jgi:hemin uptake protein HemP